MLVEVLLCFGLFTLFEKNRYRLIMRSPCSVCLWVSPRQTGIVEPEETEAARQWIGHHVPAATNTQATTELLGRGLLYNVRVVS
jgi:hypothetical protein